jgi:hypothetical protein
MRTKALLLGAIISVASLASSMAQVYSVNIVGYVNTTIPAGWSIIANPLQASPDNTLATIMPAPPQSITIYKLGSDGLFLINNYLDFLGAWDDANMPINPGEGLYVLNQGAPFVQTFVGEVLTGTQTIPLQQGWQLLASKIPQEGLLETDLKYPPGQGDGDMVYKWDNATGLYQIFNYMPFLGGWDNEPTIKVGEGFYLLRQDPGTPTWSRTFTVN